MKKKVLVVEDQFIEANNLRIILEKAGYHVCKLVMSVAKALEVLEVERPDMVLIDIYLSGSATGIELGRILQREGLAFIYISASSDRQAFSLAKQTGPYGFLSKPFRERDVLAMLDIAWYHHEQKRHLTNGPSNGEAQQPAVAETKALVGESAVMRQLLEKVKVVAASDIPVLILGESGTGKELIAKSIHHFSKRSRMPMTIVNCATLPASLAESELFGHIRGSFTGAFEKRTGKFEEADGGTIFLDEVGELPPELQIKFLRVLQEMEIEPIGGKRKKINVRVIAATNRDLDQELASGRFRMDLYYRLNVFPLSVPPLRDRGTDILLLAEHFLKLYAQKQGKAITNFSPGAAQAMMGYKWPGNVRELENQVARAVLLATTPVVHTLPLVNAISTPVKETAPPIRSIVENERDHILAALAHCNWKVYGRGGAAELLHINASTLKSRMKKLGIVKKFSSGNPGE